MKSILKIFKRYRWGIFSGVLIGTSYIPFPPWAIAFCYAPLWLWLTQEKRNLREVFWMSWWTQFILSLIGFHWISYVAHEFGFLPWPIAVLVLLAFAVFVHLYIPLAAILSHLLSNRLKLGPLSSLLTLAIVFSLAEILWPSIFPWNLGYTFLWIDSPLAQWADTVGFWGLSFGVFVVNALITFCILAPSKKRLFATMSPVLLIALLLVWGGQQKRTRWAKTDQTLNVLQVQANIGNLQKYYAERGSGYQQFIADEFFNLSQEGLKVHPETDLMVWPETAYPDYLDTHSYRRNYPSQLLDFLIKVRKPLLLGSFSKDPPELPRRREYNAVFLFNENAIAVAPPYRKTHLLIFGEYTPLSEYFPFLAKIAPGGEGFGPGSGPTVFPFKKAQLGLQICYESLYPEFSRALAAKGAEILVNVTNDSWFGPRSEPYQHLYMTLARAIETRRPLVRNTNTGISSAILADGTILEQSPWGEKWTGLYQIKFLAQPELTFYTRFGSWLVPVLFLLLGLVLFLGRNYEGSRRP